MVYFFCQQTVVLNEETNCRESKLGLFKQMACVSLSVIYTGHDAGYQTCCERLVQALIIFTSFDNCSFTGINKWNSKAVNNDHQDFIRKAVCVLTLSTTIFVHIRYLP